MQQGVADIKSPALVATRRQFASIQDLRGIAAIAVVLFHVEFLSIGYAGVDIFFVISGFIIGSIGSRERPGVFLCKRLIRVVPLYWALTAVMCLLTLIPHMYGKFSFDIYTLSKSLLFVPYKDSSGYIFPILASGWTLSYEVFFYLLFFISLVAQLPRSVLPTLLVLLVAAGQFLAPVGPGLQTYTSPMLVEFAAGLLLANTTALSGRAMGAALLFGSVVVFAVASMTGALNTGSLDPSQDRGILRVLWLGIPAIAMVAGALSLERAGYWPRITALTLVGDASYSLYLLQALVMGFAAKFLHLPMALNGIAVTGLSIAAALACYKWFERPVARLLLNLAGLHRGKTGAAVPARLPAAPLEPSA